MTVNTDDQRWRTKQSETLTRVFVGKKTVSKYTCRCGPVSLDVSVVVSQTTVPRDILHRPGSVSGTGTLAPQSRGPVPDPETVPSGKLEMIFIDVICISTLYLYIFGGKIAVSLKLNIVSHIPGSKMESILYPWK